MLPSHMGFKPILGEYFVKFVGGEGVGGRRERDNYSTVQSFKPKLCVISDTWES